MTDSNLDNGMHSGAGPDDTRIVGGSITAGKTDYAVGLVWETVTDAAKAVSLAKASAKAHAGDLYLIRKSGLQFGVGSKASGHRPGMPSVAGILAESIAGNFVGAFEVTGGFYIVAFRDEKVLSLTDRVIVGRQDAIDAFSEIFYQTDWTQSVSPKDWSIETLSHSELDDMVAEAGKATCKLKAVSNGPMLAKLAGVAVVIAVMAAGFLYYQQLEADRAAAEQTAAMAAADAKRIADKLNSQPAETQLPDLPYIGKPEPNAVIKACVDAILAAPLSVPGWKPMTAACDGTGVQLNFQRDGGTLNWVGPALNSPGFKPAVVLSGANAVVSWPIRAPAKFYTNASPIGTTSEVRRFLVAQFEEIFHQVEIREENGKPVTINGPRNQKTEVITHRILAFSFKTRHDPKDFARIFAPIPALVATSVKLDLATWTWTIEGNSYEKVPVPATGAPSAPAR